MTNNYRVPFQKCPVCTRTFNQWLRYRFEFDRLFDLPDIGNLVCEFFIEQKNENKPSKMKKEYPQKLAIQLHLIQVWLLS